MSYAGKEKLFTIALVCVFLAAFVIRLYGLETIPSGMTDDELRETYSAYALWNTGHGLTGKTLLPFIFIVNNFAFTPVPIYITAPFVGLFGVSRFTARLPYALAGFFALIGMYLLTKRLTGNKWIALATAFCMACNVWAVQLSRIAYEAGFALLFYTWGTYVFVSYSKKHPIRSMSVAMLLFFLAFNSYDAMKLLFVPLLIALAIYKWKELRSYKNILWVIILAAATTCAIFAFIYIFQHPAIRGSHFTIFQDTATATQAITSARNATLAPYVLQVLFHNRLTYFFDVFIRHYLYTFSFDFLFLSQEASGIFSLWLRGNFFIMEIPFLFLGGLYLFTRKKSVFVLSIAAMAIGAIPAGIGPEPYTYATRSIFVMPWIAFFIGAGIVYTLEFTKRHWLVLTVITVLYIFSIAGYLQQYYFEWSRNNAVYFSKGIEDLIAYVSPLQKRYPTLEIANVNDTFILHWAMYNHTDVRTLQAYYASGNIYDFPPIKILPSCKNIGKEDPRMTITKDELYVANPTCHAQMPDHMVILPDGTPQWAVYLGS